MSALGSLDSDAGKLNMNFEESSAEKVLGMWWDLQSDSFTYS